MDDLSRAMSTSALNVKHLDIDFPFKDKYNNYINGKYVAPKSGQYFENPTPISGEVLCEIARSNEEDVNLFYQREIEERNNFNPLINTGQKNPYLVDQHLLEKENV